MSIERLDDQPEELRGFEYRGLPRTYEWWQFRNGQEEIYAKVGVLLHNNQAYLYWRIVKPGFASFRSLKRVDMPAMRAYLKKRGCTHAFVQTNDKKDTHFDKLMDIIEFEHMTKTASTVL